MMTQKVLRRDCVLAKRRICECQGHFSLPCKGSPGSFTAQTAVATLAFLNFQVHYIDLMH